MIFLGCTVIGTYIIIGSFLGWTDALKKLSEKYFEEYIYNLFI